MYEWPTFRRVVRVAVSKSTVSPCITPTCRALRSWRARNWSCSCSPLFFEVISSWHHGSWPVQDRIRTSSRYQMKKMPSDIARHDPSSHAALLSASAETFGLRNPVRCWLNDSLDAVGSREQGRSRNICSDTLSQSGNDSTKCGRSLAREHAAHCRRCPLSDRYCATLPELDIMSP